MITKKEFIKVLDTIIMCKSADTLKTDEGRMELIQELIPKVKDDIEFISYCIKDNIINKYVSLLIDLYVDNIYDIAYNKQGYINLLYNRICLLATVYVPHDPLQFKAYHGIIKE